MRPIEAGDLPILELARQAATRSYSPYSRFPVGAVAIAKSGTFSGCNVENASYGLAACAERVAIFAAVATGARKISSLSVSCPKAANEDRNGRMPCGACLQVMAEFMSDDAEVIVDGVGVFRLNELIPTPFRLIDAGEF